MNARKREYIESKDLQAEQDEERRLHALDMQSEMQQQRIADSKPEMTTYSFDMGSHLQRNIDRIAPMIQDEMSDWDEYVKVQCYGREPDVGAFPVLTVEIDVPDGDPYDDPEELTGMLLTSLTCLLIKEVNQRQVAQ